MEGPVLKTRQELATEAREHYDRVALEAHDWLSTIPQAIDAWERQPELEAENDRLRALLRELVEAVDDLMFDGGRECPFCQERPVLRDGDLVIFHRHGCVVRMAREAVGDE